MPNTTQCQYCGREFKTPQSRGSHESRCKDNPNRIDLSGEKNPMYGKRGKNQWSEFDFSTVPFNQLSQQKKKLRLLEESSYACSRCGFNTRRECGASILEIDHIDGNPDNNAEDNLRVLCPNCHALTPTFRNWGNRGNKKTSSRLRKGNKNKI